MKTTIALWQVEKEYPLGKENVRALRGVDLEILAGEFTVLVGPSGSGKTTLLNLIGCMDVATKGTVTIDGVEIGSLSEKERTKLRLHKLGFIFQSFNLIPSLSVFRNVELPLLLQGNLKRTERIQKVENIVNQVGLCNKIMRRPTDLSGGEQQRVAIARALVAGPRIILADEPTANLDSENGMAILDLMQSLCEDSQTTLLLATHDAEVIERAKRVVRVKDGQIAEEKTKNK